jgi:hypothetical protein
MLQVQVYITCTLTYAQMTWFFGFVRLLFLQQMGGPCRGEVVLNWE